MLVSNQERVHFYGVVNEVIAWSGNVCMWHKVNLIYMVLGTKLWMCIKQYKRAYIFFAKKQVIQVKYLVGLSPPPTL